MLSKKMKSIKEISNQDNKLRALELIERWLQELENKDKDNDNVIK